MLAAAAPIKSPLLALTSAPPPRVHIRKHTQSLTCTYSMHSLTGCACVCVALRWMLSFCSSLSWECTGALTGFNSVFSPLSILSLILCIPSSLSLPCLPPWSLIFCSYETHVPFVPHSLSLSFSVSHSLLSLSETGSEHFSVYCHTWTHRCLSIPRSVSLCFHFSLLKLVGMWRNKRTTPARSKHTHTLSQFLFVSSLTNDSSASLKFLALEQVVALLHLICLAFDYNGLYWTHSP